MEKVGKFKKIRINGHKCEIGCMNVLDPYCVYINIGGWVKPIDDSIEVVIKRFTTSLNKMLNESSFQLFGDDIKRYNRILDIQHSDTKTSSRVKENFTFMSIELTLYFNQKISVKDERLQWLAKSIFDYTSEFRLFEYKSSKN